MMRQRFFQDLDAVAAGGEPKAIVRDPEVNRCIDTADHRPQAVHRRPDARGNRAGNARRIAPRREFPFLVGQPESVRRAYDEAMGFDADQAKAES